MSLPTRLCLLWAFSHNLVCHFEEHLINVSSCLRRCLEELQSKLLCKCSTLLSRNYSVWQVNFVGDKHFGNTLTSMRVDLFQPILNVLERSLLRAIVYQNDAHCTLVVGLSDRSESLLACCVPYLQLDALVLHIYRLYFEVNACTVKTKSQLPDQSTEILARRKA